MTPERALGALRGLGDPVKAAEMASYHKAPRVYLGVPVPAVEALVADWRATHDVPGLVSIATDLWNSDVHEARVAAAKLLTKARYPEHEELVWTEFRRWVPDFDAWAISDHACKAGERRLVAHPGRLDDVEAWTSDPNRWVRRAALVVTLPWSKANHPDSAGIEARERVLGWAAGYVSDPDRFIQKSVSWWLRSLSVRDPDRVRAFLDGPGRGLGPYARRDAARRIT